MEVFVSAPSFRLSNLICPDGSVVADVLNRFVQLQGFAPGDFYIIRNGQRAGLDDPLRHGAFYHLQPRLCGGKGGFGSMLRALGAQIEKTTNREACRDLSGRRLRDVNHEKEMGEWLKKQAEREAEKEQRRLERLQRKLSEPKHQFTDPEYQQQCHALSERLEDSVIKGLQEASGAQVRADTDESELQRTRKRKRKRKRAAECFWMEPDMLLSSDDEDDEESPSSSTSCEAAAVTTTTQTAELAQGCRSSPESSSSLAPQSVRQEEGRSSGEALGEEGRSPGEALGEEGQSPGEALGEEGRSLGEALGEEGRSPGKALGEEGRSPGKALGEEGRSLGEEGRSPGEALGEEGRSLGEEGRSPGEALREEGRSPGEALGEEGRSPAQAIRDGPMGRQPELDVSSLSSVAQLESLGLTVLKQELMSRGLKCGGTLTERATRLLSVRGLTPDQIEPALLAKPGKRKRK